MVVPHLPDELRFLVIYLLEAAKIQLTYTDSGALDEAISAIDDMQRFDLQDLFPHLDVYYATSSSSIFMEALASRHLAPDLWISPHWLLRENATTKRDDTKLSQLLVADLVKRLQYYLAHAPIIIRIGLYVSWLRSDALGTDVERLAATICGANAPLLQKLFQMIEDASAASTELQVVKDRIAPMTARDLSSVLQSANIADMFSQFATESVAAGSIGQDHLATLHDGTSVFVKVKRLGISSLMREEAKLFETPVEQPEEPSPWSDVASNLLKETSFALEIENQRRLKRQWSSCEGIEVVDVISFHPKDEPIVLIM